MNSVLRCRVLGTALRYSQVSLDELGSGFKTGRGVSLGLAIAARRMKYAGIQFIGADAEWSMSKNR
jgi:hypothetical protein